MPLPSALDANVRAAFDEMEALGLRVLRGGAAVDLLGMLAAPQEDLQTGLLLETLGRAGSGPFAQLKTRLLNLLMLLSDGRGHLERLADHVRASTPEQANEIVGIVTGLKEDYVAGRLDSLARHIEADVAADCLGNAEGLLADDQNAMNPAVAAVLLGVAFERAVRALCSRQKPVIPLVLPNGKPKPLSACIDDLKGATVYNEMRAKELRWVATLRNHAAHGQFSEFKRDDVKRMAAAVEQFLRDFA